MLPQISRWRKNVMGRAKSLISADEVVVDKAWATSHPQLHQGLLVYHIACAHIPSSPQRFRMRGK